MHFRNTLIIALLLCPWLGNAGLLESPPRVETSPIEIAQQLRINSQVLSEARRLNVYLPVNYATTPDKSYPVIYLLDGGRDEDFLHIVGLVQFLSLSWLNLMPESIVVGIENVDRKRDFTAPSTDKRDQSEFPSSGGADAFSDFLGTELKPLIEHRYRTTEHATLIGQSLGGLLASQILLHEPTLFTHYLIVSPSLWWDHESLIDTRVSVATPTEPKVFVAVGNEGSTMVRLAAALTDKLNHAYQRRDFVTFAYFSELEHSDTLHLAAYEGLQALFAEQQTTP